MLRLFILLSFLFVSSTALSDPFNQKEEVANFLSAITINKDSSMDVTEKITVYMNQKNNTGFQRVLPNYYIDSNHVLHHTNYQIRQILLNNHPIPYSIQKTKNQMILSIGTSILEPQTYFYTIQYHVTDGIHFLNDKNEIYWNVTGNSWSSPIMGASVEITLPKNTVITGLGGATGIAGSKEQAFSVAQPTQNQVVFQTTRMLHAGEDLAVSIAWPKEMIISPPMSKKIFSPTPAYSFDIIALEILILILTSYLIIRCYYSLKHRKN